jgi:hypothetical protein
MRLDDVLGRTAAARFPVSVAARRMLLIATIAPSFAITLAVDAHHSYSEYDDTKSVEVEGKLVDVAWQNPHARILVQATDSAGKPVTWDIESAGLNNFRRMNVPLEIFKVGDTVKVAGWPSKRSGVRMYGTNLLAGDGQELVMWRYSKPLWAATALGYGSDRALFEPGTESASTTLFRTWASDLDDPDANPASLFAGLTWPLTEKARQAAARFNPVEDTTTVGCTPKGMPAIIRQPFPIEFVDRGDTIALKMEEYDTLRTIHMRESSGAETPRTPLGYSVGHWEEGTLVVETTRLNEPYVNNVGVPLGPSAKLVERFSPSTDGSRLNYTLSITDPDSLTAPIEGRRSWVWRPAERVMPFNCTDKSAGR